MVWLRDFSRELIVAEYILNKNKQSAAAGGNYEVHNVSTCSYLPNPENRIHIGYYETCGPAKAEAKRKFPANASDIDGCAHCCPACHTG
ncbi:hypothetical protein [Maricaulis maris]|uniref:hypothetical protein n=1 Tax=Maricaulis maris TaxID=74318 RepID=UPI003A91A1BC